MEKIYSKRGLSAIVATVMILLITIAAAAILAGFVLPFIRGNLASSTECIPYKEYFTFDDSLGYTCTDPNNLVGFSVRAGTASGDSPTLNAFEAVFVGAGTSKSVLVSAGNATSGTAGGIRLLDSSQQKLDVPSTGEVETYIFNPESGASYSQVEIYPVLQSGRICDQSDSINLRACVGVSLTP